MIPDAVLSEIQDKVNISDLISRYLPLKRAGRSFKGLCPFHEERTPSFVVSPDKQIFHCFGCGESGNIYSFLMKHKKLDFREAAKELADLAGVVLPDDQTAGPKDTAKPEIHDCVKEAAAFYAKALKDAPRESAIRRYVEKRGLAEDALLKFGIGYSPDAWDALHRAFSKRFSDAILERAGLILPKADGGYYDRFRNRLMFPIFDVRGRYLGFGARAIDDAFPKYLNSPETEIYHKGRHLYGFHLAADPVRRADRVVIVEGYMDVIACVQAGVANAVSSSGTALTVEQVRLMKRYTRNVTVLFDADGAGEMATMRGLELLVQDEMDVRVAQMPQGHDPDSFVREFGAEKFRSSVIETAEPLFDYKIAALNRKHGTQKIEDKVKVAMEMLETIAKIPNAVLKAGLVRRLSEELKLPEAALTVEMQKKGAGVGAILRSQAARGGEDDPSSAARKTDAPMIERLLIGLFLTFPDCADRARGFLKPEDFVNSAARSVVEIIFREEAGARVRPAHVLNRISGDAEAAHLVTRAVHEVERIDDYERAFEDCVRRIEDAKQRRRIGLLRKEIEIAEMSGDRGKVNELLARFEALKKLKRAGSEKVSTETNG